MCVCVSSIEVDLMANIPFGLITGISPCETKVHRARGHGTVLAWTRHICGKLAEDKEGGECTSEIKL